MQGKELSSTQAPFGSKWWNDFLEQSNQMQDSIKISGVLTSKQIDVFYQDLKHLLSKASLGNKFRAYVDGVQQDNNIIDKFPPNDEESLPAWIHRAFHGTKFGMIINQCEQLSEYLSQQIFKDIQPLNLLTGIPLEGFNITIFLGNYGYTPLGIHQDGPGNNVLHYHLGPSQKIMYNWDEQSFDINALNTLPTEELLLLANKFVIESGDLYYMPWNKYHIGYTEAFSVGITIWFNNPTKFSYLRKLFDESMKENLNESESILPSGLYSTILDKNEFTKKIINSGKCIDQVEPLLYKYFNLEKLRLSSNAYWNSKTLAKTSNQLSKDDLQKTVLVVSPYKLDYFVNDNHFYLYYRGHRLILNYQPKLGILIEKLSKGDRLTVSDIIENLSPELTARDVIIFLTELYQKQAITFS